MEEVTKCKQCCKCFFGDKCPFCGWDVKFEGEVPDIFKDMFGDDAIKDFLGGKNEPSEM